jgi:hypothetical protein
MHLSISRWLALRAKKVAEIGLGSRRAHRSTGTRKSPGATEHSLIASFPGLPEISQIGWRLILAGWHQVAISADEIVVLTDDDMVIFLVALLS